MLDTTLKKGRQITQYKYKKYRDNESVSFGVYSINLIKFTLFKMSKWLAELSPFKINFCYK